MQKCYEQHVTVVRFCFSWLPFRNTRLIEDDDKKLKCQKFSGSKTENSYYANTSSGHRSANEQLPASVSFVELADMRDDDWTLFLEKFQELLCPAFDKRKSVTLGQKQRQRLGTSCQF